MSADRTKPRGAKPGAPAGAEWGLRRGLPLSAEDGEAAARHNRTTATGTGPVGSVATQRAAASQAATRRDGPADGGRQDAPIGANARERVASAAGAKRAASVASKQGCEHSEQKERAYALSLEWIPRLARFLHVVI